MESPGTVPMACPHCGCHLVSRADPSAESGSRGGASRGTLVCSRCAHPIEQRQDPASRRLRLGHAATLLSLVLAGGVLFTLSALHDARVPPPEPAETSNGEADGDG
jgi:hypothetical protein